MREPLFKAKRKDNGEWVQGYYYQIWGKGYILWGMTNNMPDMVEVNPDTLCQYTGLTDKNGKKIWENDIVKHKSSQCFGTIKWYCGDYVGWCVDDVHDDEQQFTMDMFNECEAIGDIFDNADLLEV